MYKEVTLYFVDTGKSVLTAATVLDSSGQVKHQCPKCQRLYSHWHSMTRHLRLECGVPPQFQCPHCDFQSTRKGSINAHIAVKHTSEADRVGATRSRYQCLSCKKYFSYKVALLKHRLQCGTSAISLPVSASGALKCPKCSFQTHLSCDLDAHIATEHFTL